MKKYLKETAKYLLRSYPFVHPYVKEIDAMYGMQADELRKRNEKKFIELFRLAYTKSHFYHEFYKDNGIGVDDIKSLEDITKLPILTKQIVKEHGTEMLTCNKHGLIANHTSGTTGTPLTVYENWEALWREQAYFICYRKRCGYKYGQPLVSLRGNLGRNDTCMKVHASNTLYLSSYNINEKTADQYYRAINKHILPPPIHFA